MKLALLTIGILLLCVGGMAIKIWGKKGGKFSGSCASQSPFLNPEGEPCSFCGRMPYEQECRKK